MIRTTRSIYIDAPVKKVFDYYKEPTNWPKTAPAWLAGSVTDVRTTPKTTGTTFTFKSKMAHVLTIEGSGEIVDVVPNRRIVSRTTDSTNKDHPETMTVLFERVGSGTTVTLVDEREPMAVERLPLVGRLVQRVVDDLGTSWLPLLKKKMEA